MWQRISVSSSKKDILNEIYSRISTNSDKQVSTNQRRELVILMPFFDHHKHTSFRHSHNVINTRRKSKMAPVSTCRENSAMTTTLENRHKKSLLNSSWSGYGILCLEGLFGESLESSSRVWCELPSEGQSDVKLRWCFLSSSEPVSFKYPH